MTQAKRVLKLPDPEDMVTCPYDPVHVVQWKRFQRHILKCKEQHPRVHLQRCPFYALHYIPPEQFEDHVANCPFAQNAFSESADMPVIISQMPNFYPPNPPVSNSNDEDWNDDEMDRPQLGMFDRVAPKPTMLPDLMHRTKAEKRKIRAQLLDAFENEVSSDGAAHDRAEESPREPRRHAARIANNSAPGRDVIELPDEWLAAPSPAAAPLSGPNVAPNSAANNSVNSNAKAPQNRAPHSRIAARFDSAFSSSSRDVEPDRPAGLQSHNNSRQQGGSNEPWRNVGPSATGYTSMGRGSGGSGQRSTAGSGWRF